ncbi:MULTISPECIES: hypothetical protein [unclassified Streptomyces]|uniref:hypothetical protein n=1 Tax=unclassified Streptomyces TaxID=2593676 RepID=UPI002E288112|nr:hypothetical protein [Streptomyces sp. NBC_00223]
MTAGPLTLVDAEDEGDLLASGVHPELSRWMAEGLAAIGRYTASEPFQRMFYGEMAAMSFEEKSHFVRSVLLNSEELARRGLTPPEGIRIQRSEFGDQRPTVFCVSQALPEGAQWKRITITFDHGNSFPVEEGGIG